eukprot:COSAG05_NODE_28_length_29121_cov_56.951933_8_plen_75_part_00
MVYVFGAGNESAGELGEAGAVFAAQARLNELDELLRDYEHRVPSSVSVAKHSQNDEVDWYFIRVRFQIIRNARK